MFRSKMIAEALAAIYSKAAELIRGTHDQATQQVIVIEAQEAANQILAIDGPDAEKT